MVKRNSTRQQILHLLKTNGSMSVGELAGELDITEMAIRRHLGILDYNGLIHSKSIRKSMGRPLNVYSLSEQADHLFPKNYSNLTLDILQDIEELEGEEKVDRLFKRGRQRLQGQYEEKMKGTTLENRVEELANLQNEKGYMAEWEKDPKTGKFIFKELNCPISLVAKEYRQVCRCELDMFRKLLETEVKQLQCMATGGQQCVYEIKG